MKYTDIEGIPIPVSQLVMGTAFISAEESGAVFDYYVEQGGNCFDTAFVYGGQGKCEKMVGAWIKDRGVRDKVVLGGKTAADTSATPKMIDDEIPIMLERLQTDHVDTFMMHRDNPDVPAGEFVDCLNAHRDAGRIKVFGGSNWECARLAEANAYATEKGSAGFAVSSPNFSLAVWNESMWPDCVTATDAESRAFYEETQIALFAWSSQASGFFTGRFDRNTPDNADIVRTWYSDENWARYDRAVALGEKKGVNANHIALAYVLNQKMKIFPLIGPCKLAEAQDSLKALDIDLSAEELRGLEGNGASKA